MSIDLRLKRRAFWVRIFKELTPRRLVAFQQISDLKERIKELRRRRAERCYFAERTRLTVACPDNAMIPRHPHAGEMTNGLQTMHNGLVVAEGSYYTPLYSRLLKANRGVHEPQEERVFQEVLPRMPAQATMVELGSYWGFYSLWFHQRVEQAHCVLVEPNCGGLLAGRLNFALNGFDGTFLNGFVGQRARPRAFGTPIVSVDSLMTMCRLEHIHILHSDIQGHELAMLRGAGGVLQRRQVDYMFISTHSEEIHRECIDLVRAHDFTVIAEHNLMESFSADGLIAARRKELSGLQPLEISKRRSGMGCSG